MEIMIIDIEYLKNTVVNDDLYNTILDSANDGYINRMIGIVESKIKLYIDIEQFNDGSEYVFPDDIKDTARYLVESLYMIKKEKANVTKGNVVSESEKFDDYSTSKTYEGGGILFYDIPILPDYLAILDLYRPCDASRFGNFSINLD